MGFYYHNLHGWAFDKIGSNFWQKTDAIDTIFVNTSVDSSNMDSIAELSQKITNQAEYIIVVGIGGSILSPMSLVKFFSYHHKDNNSPKQKFSANNIYFIYYLDCIKIDKILKTVGAQSVFVLVLSRSGITLEVIEICRYLDHCRQNYTCNHYYWYAFTDLSNETPLASFLYDKNATIIQYNQGCAGRFSSFANQSLLLLKIIGVDIEQFCKGGAEVFRRFKNSTSQTARSTKYASYESNTHYDNLCHNIIKNDNFDPIPGASSIAYGAKHGFVAATMSYHPPVQTVSKWYTMALAETLGKPSCSLIPENIILPFEQHGKMQNYLGSNVKVVMTFLEIGQDYDSKNPTSVNPNSFFADAISKCRKALFNAVKTKQIPYRLLTINSSSEYNLGRLIGNLILEVVVAGLISKINPFEQTEIDNIKKFIRES